MTDFAQAARIQPWRPRPALPPAAAPGDRPFPDLLRGHRIRSGLTQRALADLSTVSPRAIRDLESGRANARTQTLHLLADALRLNGLHRDLFVHAALSGREGADTDAHLAVPRPVSALLGRDAEVRAMVEVLESGRRRMISISGLPGVGKSRLAAEIAARLRAERGWPVLWFGAQTWVAGEPATPYEPLMRSLRTLIESASPDVAPVAKLLGRHEALLILDGIADTRAPNGVAELLAYCPGVRLISTSRAPWYVPGVRAAVVPPLATPDEGTASIQSVDLLARVPSVRLLIDRVAEIRPGFALTPANAAPAAELCRRLDGLPLAIELLAARTRVLSLRQLAEIPASALLDLVVPAGEDGVPETIGGLIASVYERIDGDQRAIVRQLARTHGPWTAAGVAAALERPLDEVVDALSALIGHGVITASHGEPATDLHIPNLLRAVLRRKSTIGTEASMPVSSQPTFVGLNARRSSPQARHATEPVAPTTRGGKGMATNSADALRKAGIIGGTMSPELEEFYSSLTKEETDVLISTRNRLAAILPDVEAHAQGWSTPEATGQDFDAAMLCACGLWSGSGAGK